MLTVRNPASEVQVGLDSRLMVVYYPVENSAGSPVHWDLEVAWLRDHDAAGPRWNLADCLVDCYWDY